MGSLVFAEDALFVGFVVPGETVAILGGVAASLGHVPLGAVLAVVVVGGDRRRQRRLRGRPPLRTRVLAWRPAARAHADRLDDARDLLARRGGWAVLLGRWVAFFRAVMPALAGTTEMRYRTFLTFNALGGILWGTAVVVGGYLAGASYQAVADAARHRRRRARGRVVVAGLVVWRVRRRRAPAGPRRPTPHAGSPRRRARRARGRRPRPLSRAAGRPRPTRAD